MVMYNDHMKVVSATEFKTHCLRLMDEVNQTKEPLEVRKRGRAMVVLNPPPEVDWTPGAFKGTLAEVGDICVDGAELGVRWEAME